MNMSAHKTYIILLCIDTLNKSFKTVYLDVSETILLCLYTLAYAKNIQKKCKKTQSHFY